MLLETNLAEIHSLKTEYAASRFISAQLLARIEGQVPTLTTFFLHLNIALVDVAASGGADVGHLYDSIETARRLSESTGFPWGNLYCDTALADLELCQGNADSARRILDKCLASAQESSSDEATTFCLERFSNPGFKMHTLDRTARWAAIFLVYSMKTKEKLSIMKALYCLGLNSAEERDDETALALFRVALDGLTFMDVHRWRANCMVGIADVLVRRGEVVEAAGLWRAARPLFERSSQAKDVARVDSMLDALDAKILEDRLAVLTVSDARVNMAVAETS
jgi:hypothetical protein